MQTIGERLEEARKRRGVTIREAAEATKIRGDYLNSFENNNFNINVPDIYVRGFLRSYSNFLKINSEKIITDFNTAQLGETKAPKREHREFFGRMELQRPLVSEESRDAAHDEEERPRKRPSSDSGASTLGFLKDLNKEVLIKVGIVAVIALLVIVTLVWVFKLIAGGDETPANGNTLAPAGQSSALEQDRLKLIASGDVYVSVVSFDNPDEIILEEKPLTNGQSIEVSKDGPVILNYSFGTHLTVEVKGKSYPMKQAGPGRIKIP